MAASNQIGHPPRAFIIEGLMGAGKTTLLHNLALQSRLDNWNKKIRWIREPVARLMQTEGPFAGALKKFYTGELGAFAFQSFVYLELLERDLHARQIVLAEANDGSPFDAIVMDRHLSSCRAFAGILHKRGDLTDFELQLVSRQCALYDAWGDGSGFTSSEAALIYLDISPELAIKRIAQRNRAGEDNISLEYLSQLREEHQAQFPNYKAVHRIPVGAELSPSEACEAAVKIIMAEI